MTSSFPKNVSAYQKFLLHQCGLVIVEQVKMGVQRMMPSNNKKNAGMKTGLTLLSLDNYEDLSDL